MRATLPTLDASEWMTLTNIYYGHVKDEWAFAMAAAAALAENVTLHNPGTLAALKSPMGRKESYLSFDLMCDANADPTKAETYAAVYRRMNSDMDKIDAELAGSSSALPLGATPQLQMPKGNQPNVNDQP
jgi:hypothetical protein